MALEGNITSLVVSMQPLVGDAGLVSFGKAIGAGLAVGLSAIGTGKAQGTIGAAGVGAMAEDEKMMGKSLIFLALPETAVILGFVIAILLIL